MESVPRFESKISHTKMVRSCPADFFHAYAVPPTLSRPKKSQLNLHFPMASSKGEQNTHISPTLYSRLRQGPRELFLLVDFQCFSLANKESSKVIVRKHLRKDEPYLKVKIDGDSRYQKVGDRKGSKNKPICRNG